MYSESAWPISGGIVESVEILERQMLLTGHEDGSIRFWDVTGVAMTPLYKYTTSQLFRYFLYMPTANMLKAYDDTFIIVFK